MKIPTISRPLVAAFALFAAANASAVPVELELALLVDVSGSVDASEYSLQKNGYVQAFQSAAIHNLVSAATGGIAVTYIEWSSGNQQAQLVGWTHLTDAASSNAFAAAITGTSRAFSGNTAPGSAIAYATPLFDGNGFEGTNLVIDVSGDGTQNSGVDTSDARDDALDAGIDRINGLPIGGASITTFYQNNIQGGTGAFVIPADSFADFATAVQNKLTFEIGGGGPGTPDGGTTWALLGLAFGALVTLRRRLA